MKKAAFFLSALLLLSFLFGCAPRTGGAEETTDIIEEFVTVLSGGQSEYSVVRAEGCDETIRRAGILLTDAVTEQFSVTLQLRSDFYRAYQKIETPAIYVGVTTERECAERSAGLKSGDFTLSTDGVNIYLLGGSSDAVYRAVEYFIGNYVRNAEGGNLVFPMAGYSKKAEYAFSEITLFGQPISECRIVYANSSEYAQSSAEELAKLLAQLAGVELKVISDSRATTGGEIVVGASTRKGTAEILASFGGDYNRWKCVPMESSYFLCGAGFRTEEAAASALMDELRERAGKNKNLTLELSEVLLEGDVNGSAKAERDPAADLRIMDANVLLTDDNPISTEKRGMIFCDIVRTYWPEVICFNEFYYNIDDVIRRGLDAEYEFITPDFEDIFNSDYTGYTNDLAKLQTHECAEIIAFRKDAGLKVCASGFRYTTEKWWVHAISWVLFERSGGGKFIAMANHYGEQSIADFGAETVACITELRQKYGDLPIIVTGDLYAWAGDKPYQTILAAGFEDTYADQKTRVTQGRGSSHAVGNIMTGTSSPIDHILCTPNIRTLKHHLIADKYSMWCSDHFPIYADLDLPD